jgi:hypothetical protein
MKILNMERVRPHGRSQALATFDVELDDGSRCARLALVQVDDGRRELLKGHGLSPVIAARILAAVVAEYDGSI